MNTLIIDSGGTKAQWVCLAAGRKQAEGTVPGIHPFFLNEHELAQKLREIDSLLPPASVGMIFHYGTGTNSDANRKRLRTAYYDVFPDAQLAIESDLLAVARGLCRKEAGIAAILGTGSNVGLYDGRQFQRTAGGLGYVLGDEGSGAHLGKTLLNNYINGVLPTELSTALEQEYQLSRESILEAVYRQPFPNRYLASMAPFLAAQLDHPFIDELVRNCFYDFFRLNILPLQADPALSLNCGGSIAFHFEKKLREVADGFGVAIKHIAMSPMAGLISYHT